MADSVESTADVERPFDAASRGRRTHAWSTGGWGPNAAAVADHQVLINRARSQGRNNSWIKNGVSKLAANEVGRHINVLFRSANDAFNTDMAELFEGFIDECDANGALNLHGLLAQAAGSRPYSGEVFARLRPRRRDSRYTIPLQIQLLEPEYVPIHETRLIGNGNHVRHGIEFNSIGDIKAYWVYPRHPGDYQFGFNINQLVRVPAGLMLHSFWPSRPGQLRGAPEIGPAMLPAWVYGDYSDSERERKRTRAKITGSIERDPIFGENGDFLYDVMTGRKLTTDTYEQPVTDFETGTLFQALPGEKLNWYDGDDSGQGYREFQRMQLTEIAAGCNGIPYQLLTGDWEHMTDRMWRAVANMFDRESDMRQQFMTIHQLLRPIKDAAIEIAWLAGRISAEGFDSDAKTNRNYRKVEYRPDTRPYMHPLQDVQAAATAVAEGFTTREAEAAKRGEDAVQIDRVNEADHKRRQKKGLKYGTKDKPDAQPMPATTDDQEDQEDQEDQDAV